MSLLPKLILFLSLLPGAHAATTTPAPSCPDGYALLQNSNLETLSPKLQKFLEGKAIQKLNASQPESFQTLESKVANILKGKGSIFLDNQDFTAAFDTVKTADSITLKIKYFGVKKPDNTVVDLGDRNKIINNFSFPRMLTAVFSGLEKQLAADPALKTIKLEGSMVMNSHLAETLEEFGFRSKYSFTAKFYDTVGQSGLTDNVFWLLSAASGMGTMGVPVKGGILATTVVQKIRARRFGKVGRDWILKLDIKDRPTITEQITAGEP